MAGNTIMTAKNTFGDGLLMDFAPDNTQATCLTHALNATRKKQGVNLQVVTLEDGTKVRLSAREIRTSRKNDKVQEVSE